jgi:hypothetical protein
MPTKSTSGKLSEHCCTNVSGSPIPRIYAKCSRTFSSRFPIPGKQRREEYVRHRPPKEIRSLTQSLRAPDLIKEEQRNQQDMSNTSNKTSKSSKTYSRETLAEQEEAFWLLGELQQELAREQEGRHAEQGIASEAYKYVAGENDLALTVTATVKPGRFPNTFELVAIE